MLHARGRVLAVNNAYLLDPLADCLYFNDKKWFGEPNWHSRELYRFRGELIVTQAQIDPGELPIKRLKPTHKWPLSRHPQMLAGWDGGSRALNLAYLLGANPIVLVGFDMRPGHWHGGHKGGELSESPYGKFIAHFNRMAPELACDRVTVLNATPGSDLQCFPICGIIEALEELPHWERS